MFLSPEAENPSFNLEQGLKLTVYFTRSIEAEEIFPLQG